MEVLVEKPNFLAVESDEVENQEPVVTNPIAKQVDKVKQDETS